jgi:DNA (cytosine-5)-methyltransferase 1
MIRIGSAFSGIGGFELGLERAIPNSKTVWQIEQNPFCQKILRKHWPDAKIYDDVREVGAHNLEPVDIFCAGFPCQDISVAGKGEGLDGKKSGLWWECFRIISELRPRIIVLENVSAVTFRGGREVVGSLASIGYDTEWQVISARMFGAPHIRRRWFLVGYASDTNSQSKPDSSHHAQTLEGNVADTNSERSKEQPFDSFSVEQERQLECRSSKSSRTYEGNYWQRHAPESPVCRVDDGFPNRMDRLRALGNAIVPQCSEYIGRCIVESGLL